jgi:hypothetical protein
VFGNLIAAFFLCAFAVWIIIAGCDFMS